MPKQPTEAELIRLLLSMLSDLQEGYDWSELAVSLEFVKETASEMGITTEDYDPRDASETSWPMSQEKPDA